MSDGQKIYTLLNEIYLILDDGDRRLLSQFSLTPPRYYALVHLGDRPGMSLSELSNLMLCDKSNATRIIRSLEADGLVYRLPHETDGRSIRLFLSQEGQELRKRSIRAHNRYNHQRFDKDIVTEQDELLEELVTLRQRLRDSLNLAYG
jgi:DNA-binding MarR family transcriptional regulator